MSEIRAKSRRPTQYLRSPGVLIRAASALCGGLTVGHLSGYPWTSAKVAQEAQLVGSMKTGSFVFAGERQTYWALYFGWGVLVAVLLLAVAITLWLMSDLASLAPRRVGAMAGVFAAASLAGGLISLRFFYAPPTAFFALLAILLLVAAAQLARAGRETPGMGGDKVGRP